MSLPRLFARAEGPTRGRFAEVLQAFESGESLARAQELDLRELRALPPYALEGYGRALSQERPHVLRDLWPRLSAAEATLVAIGAGWAAEERSRRIDVPAPYDGAAADGGGFARALFHAYALGHPQRFEHDLPGRLRPRRRPRHLLCVRRGASKCVPRAWNGFLIGGATRSGAASEWR